MPVTVIMTGWGATTTLRNSLPPLRTTILFSKGEGSWGRLTLNLPLQSALMVYVPVPGWSGNKPFKAPFTTMGAGMVKLPLPSNTRVKMPVTCSGVPRVPVRPGSTKSAGRVLVMVKRYAPLSD